MLHDDACVECGTITTPSTDAVTMPINGIEITVEGVPHLKCPKCGEGMFSLDQARQLREKATAKYHEQKD